MPKRWNWRRSEMKTAINEPQVANLCRTLPIRKARDFNVMGDGAARFIALIRARVCVKSLEGLLNLLDGAAQWITRCKLWAAAAHENHCHMPVCRVGEQSLW